MKTKNNSGVRKPKGIMASTQQHIKIAEIRDNTMILKDGSVRGILQVNAVNFDLKSEDEQNALIYSYQGFLNTLEFPVQILVRSRKLDVDVYLEKILLLAENQQNELLKDQTYDYIDYIKRLIEMADIMKKTFYAIVPNNSFVATKAISPITKLFHAFNPKDTKSEFQKRSKEFESLKKGLDHRTQVVQNALENIGLSCEQLDTAEIIELFYESYNPETSELQKMPKLEEINLDMV